MPDRKLHEALSKMLFGESGEEIHKFMDAPSKYFGKGHRKYLHDIPTVIALGLTKGSKAAGHALGHILLDKSVTSLEQQAKTAVRSGVKSLIKRIEEFRKI